jgi:hypothetical protein
MFECYLDFQPAHGTGSCHIMLARTTQNKKKESIEDSKTTDEHSPGMLRLNKHDAASVG